MAYDLLPNNLIQQTSDASTEQAKQLLANASSMAGTYLQNLKTMAGGSADQPIKTMAKDQMDQNNALAQTNEYMDVSGKVPGADFLKSVGLFDVLGPLAGQDTLNTQNAQDDLAVKWYNATKKGSGGGGGLTAAQQLALMKYEDGVNAANEKTVQGFVDKMLKEMSPTKSAASIGLTDNTFYRNGHAYPREALKKYKSLIGNDEIYNEVYKRIMGQYDPTVQKSGTNGVSGFRQIDQTSNNQAFNW